VTTVASSAAGSWNFTSGAKTGTPAASAGTMANWGAQSFTDNNTASNQTATSAAFFAIQRPGLLASSSGVFTTTAATFYVAGAPIAGSNETIVNSYAAWFDQGTVRVDDNLSVGGNVSIAGSLYGSGAQVDDYNLSASVASNILTVNLLAADGTTPTSSNPATVYFRTSPVTTGSHTKRTATSATTATLSSGSTLGMPASHRGRIWIVGVDNSGTIEMGFWRSVTPTSVLALDETSLYNTNAEGGAGGADSHQVIYTATARTNVPIRILGYLDIQTGQPQGSGVMRPLKSKSWGRTCRALATRCRSSLLNSAA
jgi:hypothetical protein